MALIAVVSQLSAAYMRCRIQPETLEHRVAAGNQHQTGAHTRWKIQTGCHGITRASSTSFVRGPDKWFSTVQVCPWVTQTLPYFFCLNTFKAVPLQKKTRCGQSKEFTTRTLVVGPSSVSATQACRLNERSLQLTRTLFPNFSSNWRTSGSMPEKSSFCETIYRKKR